MIIGEKGRIFRIAGVSGSGKTTITAILASIIKESNNLFECINLRKIQCELAGVKNEEEYRKIPEEKRRELFPFLINKITLIADAEPNKIWLFERHLCSMNEKGNIVARGIPQEHGKRMIGLAVVFANNYQISVWRKKDNKIRQDRHLLTDTQIAKEQIKEIKLALEAGHYFDFPVHFFFNQNGYDEKIALDIISFMKKVAK